MALPVCLYAVSLGLVDPTDRHAIWTGFYVAASQAEAIGAAVLEWEEKHSKKFPYICATQAVSAEYDQMAWVLSQAEYDEEQKGDHHV